MARKKYVNGLPKPPRGCTWHYNPQTKVWKVVNLKDMPPHHDLLMDATLMMQGIDNLKYPEKNEANEDIKQVFVPPPVAKPKNNYNPNKIHQHKVRRGDTFQGICLRYDITPTQLRQANNFGGSNLQLAPTVLTIPVDPATVKPREDDDDNNTVWVTPREVLMSAVMDALADNDYGTTRLSPLEAKCYLEMHDWDVDKAVEEAREDAKFEAECQPGNHHEFKQQAAEQVQ